MLEAGLTLTSALEALGNSHDLAQAELGKSLVKDLHSGMRLSKAFSRWENSFDTVFVGTIYTAEQSGTLVNAIRALTDQMIEQDKNRKTFMQSLTYPVIQFSVTVLMVIFLLYYMLPRFMPFFAASGEKLPALTQLVLTMSQSWVIRYSPVILLLFLAIAIRAWRNREFRETLVRWSFYLPVVGRLMYRQSLANCCNQLALQLETGLLLDYALKATARCSPFPPLSRMFLRLRRAVRDGEDFAEKVDEESLIPPIMAICIGVGNETGRLPPMLRLGSGILEEEIEVKRDAFFQLLEPLLLMVMGLAVGVIVLACFLPVYHLAMANM